MSEPKSIGFILRKGPYQGYQAQEAVEALLGTAVYGQEISVIFMDDGVYQLVAGQEPESIQRKSLEKMLSALALYDIDQAYVCSQSLAQRKLSSEALAIPCQSVDETDLSALLRRQDVLLSY